MELNITRCSFEDFSLLYELIDVPNNRCVSYKPNRCSRGLNVEGQRPPRCRLALIESPRRGRNFRKMSDARSILVPPFSRLTFSSRQHDATRRDVTRCFTSAYETRKDRCTRTSERATYFCRTRVLLSQTVPLLREIPYILPSSRLLATPLHPLSSRREDGLLLFIPYPLFFILYIPVYLGRQTRVPRIA